MAGLGLLVLLMISLAISQFVETSGPPIAWETDLTAALARAEQSRRRVFLYLHGAACEYTPRYERTLFLQRSVRNRLAEMVPCRLEVKAGDAAARRYGFTNDPVMVVLDANGLPLTQPLVGGHIEDKQFLTYIQSGIDR